MESNANIITTSIGQVTVLSIILEDYSSVVEHCINVLNKNTSILYIVITRKDGFSLIFKGRQWRYEHLDGMWRPAQRKRIAFLDYQNPLVAGEVFHYSVPVDYSGIPWGWIHLGLSTGSAFQRCASKLYPAVPVSHWQYDLGPGRLSFFCQKTESANSAPEPGHPRSCRGEISAPGPGFCQETNWGVWPILLTP